MEESPKIDVARTHLPSYLALPESAMVVAAWSLSIQVSPRFLWNHALRTCSWGFLLAKADQVEFDRELLCVASLLHDLGLTERFRGTRCFEKESAEAAVRLARDGGWDSDRCSKLGEVIRLHMQPRVVREDGPEAYLLSEAAAYDVTGSRYEDLPSDLRDRVLSIADREGFKEGFTRLFLEQARLNPGCMANVYMRQGLAERIASAPFAD